jgi:acylphosphatase
MAEQGTERRRIVFAGRVQGVGFRATARGIARGLPVTGWVRNEADGSVCVEVQGSGPGIDAFIEELRRIMGRLITSETAAKVAAQVGEQGFEIRR